MCVRAHPHMCAHTHMHAQLHVHAPTHIHVQAQTRTRICACKISQKDSQDHPLTRRPKRPKRPQKETLKLFGIAGVHRLPTTLL